MSLALACAFPGSKSPLGSAQEGLASYYATSLIGHRTASGERYDPKTFTAAHRTLPLGSLVRVERIANNGSSHGTVDVRINDRGPFVRSRIIDLSDAAARRLGMKSAGVARVRIRILSLP